MTEALKCPLCENDLHIIDYPNRVLYECRVNYIYLNNNYPICHYTFNKSKDDALYKTQHRFMLMPFGIITFVKENKSKILYFIDKSDINFNLIDIPAIYVNKKTYNKVLKKLQFYLLYI